MNYIEDIYFLHIQKVILSLEHFIKSSDTKTFREFLIVVYGNLV